MEYQTLDSFERIIWLAGELDRASDPREAFNRIDVEQTCFEVYFLPVVEEMFLAAIGRLADRKGLALMRLDHEDGVPSMVLSLGVNHEDARKRAMRFYEMRQEEKERS